MEFIGMDDGHFGVKMVWGERADQKYYIPSRVVVAEHLQSLSGDDDNVYVAGNQDSEYAVVENGGLEVIDTRFNEFYCSPVNHVLIHHALYRAGFSGKQISMVTGLPVNRYFVSAGVNNPVVSKKISSLANGDVRNRNASVRLAEIIEHTVMSEAVAAFMDQAVRFDGTPEPEFNELISDGGSVAVVDIGGKTTDTVVIIDGGKNQDPRTSGTLDIGALDLYAELSTALLAELNVAKLGANQIDSAARTGEVRMFGKRHDVSSIVRDVKAKSFATLNEEIKRRLGDGASYERIVFVGGGAELYRELLVEMYPHHGVIPHEPSFSNARGMHKAAVMNSKF